MRAHIEKVIDAWESRCSAEIAVAVLGGAWKPSILHALDRATVLRFGELTRELGEPSPRVLTRQLRELEQDGLVSRQVYPEVPPRVEYRLTDLGTGAQDLLDAMAAWGIGFVAAAREKGADASAADQRSGDSA
ncbi:helix-turn-helix domain-containing protein [Tsukamurella sp. 8F]|uniref:winged helix-turn-helix transcriptional regulator n=1 Tax=unclassified Tsukamurella TaxID=2633480 RepID=UPI0023B8D9D7|nr:MULTISPECIES: helix-turn-helix domain-containing protein [unclassified Tsukamurella]MDF0528479.1 helix-turn-helix domain-containing protein [Tsukamurella sp. 8J]MDF0586305.1 helix-turn-helix domain-containing protein [Tsukamurella sp. 8F]